MQCVKATQPNPHWSERDSHLATIPIGLYAQGAPGSMKRSDWGPSGEAQLEQMTAACCPIAEAHSECYQRFAWYPRRRLRGTRQWPRTGRRRYSAGAEVAVSCGAALSWTLSLNTCDLTSVTACSPTSMPRRPRRAIAGGAGDLTLTSPYTTPTATPRITEAR
jgi:hypothetical protein